MQTINELTLSKDLIKFPTVTPIDAGAIKFLSKKLKSLGFNCKILEFKKGKGKPISFFYPFLIILLIWQVTIYILRWRKKNKN